MKTLKKNAIALVMALVLVLSPMTAFAEELPTEAVYDIEKGGTQEFFIRDAEGNAGTVIIEEIEGQSRVANGNYRVTYDNTGCWTAGFYVTISGNQITKAYSPFHSVAVGEIKLPVLTKNSATKATYAFVYKKTLLSFSTGVVAQISNSKLVVSKK